MPSIAILGNAEDFFDHLEGLVMDRSASPHSCIHLYVDGRLYIRLLAFFLKFPGEADIRDRRHQIVFDDLVNFRAGGGAQDQDGSCDIADAQLHAFVCIGNAQKSGAIFQGDVGNLDCAVAVSIRLDYLKNSSRPGRPVASSHSSSW